MNIKDVLFMRKTGKPIPSADLPDIVFGLKLHERDYGGVVKTATGNPVSIVTNIAQNAISTLLSYSPRQSGSGDPSPQNIRPIEGWTEANLFGCGKNLFDINSIGDVVTNYDTSVTRIGIEFSVSGTYTISVQGSGQYMYCRVFNADNSIKATYTIVVQATITNATFTITKGEHFVLYDANPDNYETAKGRFETWLPQIELGSTATTYEPYTQGSDYTISLGGTYYGFSLDVERGVLMAKHAIIDLGSLDWTLLGSGRHTANIADAKIIPNEQTANAICTQYKVTYASGIGNINYGFAIGLNNRSDIIINDIDLNGTSGADFQTAMDGVMCVYELATPIELPLTPQTVALLAGNNTLWTDGDEVSVTYKAKK